MKKVDLMSTTDFFDLEFFMPSHFIKQRNQTLKKLNPALSLVENAMAIKKSPSTVYRWSISDMSTKAQKSRLATRGKKRHLSPEQEKSIFDWVLESSQKGLTISGKDISSFILRLTHGQYNPDKSMVSRICKRLGISSKVQKKRQPKQLSPQYQEEIQEFRTKILSLNTLPSE